MLVLVKMIQFPIIGAFLEASGMILEKRILRRRKLDFKNYTSYEFLVIVILLIPFLYFFWNVTSDAFTKVNLLIFGFVVLTSVLANLFIFYSLKKEKLTEFEPAWLMQPLFTVLLAFIFYKDERNWIPVVLSLIASVSLVLSHIRKHHLVFDKYIIAALLGNFFFAVELVASKNILVYYSPFSFYFLRCIFIFAITFAIYRPSFRILKDVEITLSVLLIGLIWIFYRALLYYSYISSGIVFTTLLFILAPVLMFVYAVIFLKEKPNLRQIITTIIIFICVALTFVFN